MLTSCIDDIADFNVKDPEINYSDHLPLFARITNIVLDNKKYCNGLPDNEVNSQKYLRWDHADLTGMFTFMSPTTIMPPPERLYHSERTWYGTNRT